MGFNKKFFTTGGIVASTPPAAAAGLDPLQNFETVTYTGNGSTQKITGYIRKGAAFNGSSSKIVLPKVPRSSSMTLSCWVRSTNIGIHAVMLQNGAVFRLGIDNSGYATASNLSGTNNTGTTLINDGNWHHILAVFNDASGNKLLYVDGVLEDTETYSSGSRTYVDGIGVDNTTVTPACTIDQVRIFNKAISSSEVTTLYGETYASSTKSTTDIFGDGSGVALYELDDSANDTGGYPYGTGDIDSGQSGIFNGSSSQLVKSSFASLSQVGISMWVNIADVTSNYTLIARYGTYREFAIYNYQASNGFVASIYYDGNSGNAVELTAGDYLKNNTWHHIAFTSDGTTQPKLYIDGIERGTSQGFSPAYYTSTEDLQIGAGVGRWLDGKIDQVRIYSTALSSSDVTNLVSETNVPTSNLVAHYKLDGNGNDATGNGYNATATDVTYSSDPAEFPLITNNGTATNVNFLGMAFQPDLVWIKDRSVAREHILCDSVRGVNKELSSDVTDAEESRGVTSFDSNGFSLDGLTPNYNGNNEQYVAWCWKAGGTAVSNTDGTITSQVSANQDAGFSIATYTGTGSNTSFGHGLSVAPELVIIKSRTTAYNWIVHVSSLGAGAYMLLNGTNANATSTARVNTVDSSVVNIGTSSNVNGSGAGYVCYSFHSVDGYQKVGSYTSSYPSTTSVNVGFQPRFVMIKSYNQSRNWVIHDSARTDDKQLYPNLTNTEADTGTQLQFTSTGFDVSGGSNDLDGGSSYSYIYLAIA